MRYLAVQSVPEIAGVIRVNLRIVAGAGNRHIRQAAIDELRVRFFGIDIHEHAVGRRALAAVARHRVSVIEMPIFVKIEADLAAGVELDSNVAALVNALDGAQLAIGDSAAFCREL